MTEAIKTRCINLANSTFSLKHQEIHELNQNLFPDNIDKRLQPFLTLKKWNLFTKYKGNRVDIPGFPGSSFHVVKYFKVVKEPGDPLYNGNEDENEIGCTIWAGWKGYDHEVEINLFITGKDVLSGKGTVKAEILKCGSANMVLTFKDKIVTSFSHKHWFGTRKFDKIWITNLNQYL